jgi:hypothetical protein
MMMRLLRAGGIELVTDEIRAADYHNPEGYFELEQVKTLDKTDRHPWLTACRGKAVKVISFLLPYLPDDHNYRVIFMRRELGEVIASQDKMLTSRGQVADPDHAVVSQRFQDDLRRVELVLGSRPCFEKLEVSSNAAVADSATAAARINSFLGGALNLPAMAAAVDSSLYRNRA